MEDVIWIPNNAITLALAEKLEVIINPVLEDTPGEGCYLEGCNLKPYQDGLPVEGAPALRLQIIAPIDDRDFFTEEHEVDVKMLWDALQSHVIEEATNP